ncbi:MAG: uracil-DNA glycosylase [Chlamydiales bacterium]
MHTFKSLNEKIISCTRCPRLVYFREHAPERKAFRDQAYWRKPVPGFGDPNGWLLILGMAPAAQGANRTGRIFTGDESARFLMHALYLTGFANQPSSRAIDDHLKLKGCFLTAAVKCVPPANHPSKEEFANCSSYFENELFLLKNLQTVLALGKLAFDAYQRFLKKENIATSIVPFRHGERVSIKGWPTLYGSYHPSPQNTYTKKLTEKMFVKLLDSIKQNHQ